MLKHFDKSSPDTFLDTQSVSFLWKYLILKFKCYNMFCACIVCQSINVHTSINKPGSRQALSRTYAYATNTRPRTFLYDRTERKPRGDSPEENGASTSCRFSIVSRVPLGRTLALLEDCTDCNKAEKIEDLRNGVPDRDRRRVGTPWELAASILSSSVFLPRSPRSREITRASRSILHLGDFEKGEENPRENFIRAAKRTSSARPLARAHTSSPHFVRARH